MPGHDLAMTGPTRADHSDKRPRTNRSHSSGGSERRFPKPQAAGSSPAGITKLPHGGGDSRSWISSRSWQLRRPSVRAADAMAASRTIETLDADHTRACTLMKTRYCDYLLDSMHNVNASWFTNLGQILDEALTAARWRACAYGVAFSRSRVKIVAPGATQGFRNSRDRSEHAAREFCPRR